MRGQTAVIICSFNYRQENCKAGKSNSNSKKEISVPNKKKESGLKSSSKMINWFHIALLQCIFTELGLKDFSGKKF